MDNKYYDRYSKVRVDGKVTNFPPININLRDSDIYVIFDKNKMRLDTLSYKYYGDPNYAWLILKSNPQYGCYEFNIDNGVKLRIPYPLHDALSRYEKSIERNK